MERGWTRPLSPPVLWRRGGGYRSCWTCSLPRRCAGVRANAAHSAWRLERHMGGGMWQEWLQQLQQLLLLLLIHM